jgi:hypothetical protein
MLGDTRVVVGSEIKKPKKLKHVEPSYTTDDLQRTGSGLWIGEALVETDGKVRKVWTLHEPTFEPPWPEFDQAVRDAILKWEYAPALRDDTPIPVCLTVTVHLHYR